MEVLTTGAAARILGVSSDRVRQLEAAGQISAIRTTTGVRMFDRVDVEALAAARAAKRPAEGAA